MTGSQLGLFADEDRKAGRRPVEAAAPDPALLELAQRLPPQLRLGTSSWSFPGWAGIVWARDERPATLAREGLTAYAAHPLLRAVGLDRTFYAPLPADRLDAYVEQTGPGFRFVVKAHDLCTRAELRDAAGGVRGNPLFLDAGYASEAVVAPLIAGLGERCGAIVFQLPPQSTRALGGRKGFPERLARFLTDLPHGPLYAVELRNPEMLVPAYRDALRAADAVHCINVHPRMPDPRVQAERTDAESGRALVVRWMLNRRFDYAGARERYAPFDRLVDEDPDSRHALAELCEAMTRAGRPATVIANNKAEGSAPLTLVALARGIAAGRGSVRGP